MDFQCWMALAVARTQKSLHKACIYITLHNTNERLRSFIIAQSAFKNKLTNVGYGENASSSTQAASAVQSSFGVGKSKNVINVGRNTRVVAQ